NELYSISTSCLSANNWNGANFFSMNLNAAYDVVKQGQYRKIKVVFEGHFDSAWTYFIDSIFKKNIDEVKIRVTLSEKNKKSFSHIYSLSVSTQLFEGFTTGVFPSGRPYRILSSKFFDPGTIEAGYGISGVFWTFNYVSLSFATIRIYTIPYRDNL